MRKVVAAINMTLDGYFDHTVVIPDDDLHKHYADLMSEGDVILYGRITYQLMEYWRTVVENPTGDEEIDRFARVMDSIPKIVFSHTLKSTDWETAKLAKRSLEEEVRDLKKQTGRDIFVGSRSLIVSLTNLHLIDEYQLCVHPVIAGHGSPLFDKINDSIILKFVKTKTLKSGAVVLYYQV